ncbi:MAG: pyruvate kinase [Solirubrobacterales bacterium]
MENQPPRKTKIVATIGPSSWDPPVLREMIEAGVDVMRLNFSHSDEAQHSRIVSDIREASKAVGREIGILGDLPGPKLRVGAFPDGVVEIIYGAQVKLVVDEDGGTADRIPVPWPAMPEVLKDEAIVYLADGSIRLRVTGRDDEGLIAEVEVGGPLSSNKGMNLPGVDAGLDAVSDVDLGWVDFSVRQELDLLAVSFVRRASDLTPVMDRLKELGSDLPVIAKIEKPQAADAIESVVAAASGGIMIARGDLGIEVPLSRVPVLQKHLIRAAGHESKPAITATQMLASMVHAKRPTRAEVTDVATAIYDGTDAVMLSEETAVGDFPVEAVKVMDQIARATEPDLPYWEWLLNRTSQEEMDVSASVTQSAVVAAYRLDLKSIVVPTSTGRTAVVVAAHRPKVPVLAVTHTLKAVRRLRLVFGVEPVLYDQVTEIRDLLYTCADVAVAEGAANSGELIAIVAGLTDQRLGTNLFEVHRVP